MTGEECTGRTVLRLTGADRIGFLQGLVTNDVRPVADGGAVYAALLTPQGKFLADFFLVGDGEAVLIDVAAALADGLRARLAMYRLRADVAIEATGLHVRRGLGAPPDGGFADPRHPALGWRAIGSQPGGPPAIDWDALRVALLVPESGIELVPDDTYILEAGFERLHGVDFRKGCYVGQEVTARMKHKTDLRKGLVRAAVAGDAPAGTPVTAGGRTVGRLTTRAGTEAIVHVRFDQAEGILTAGDATLRLLPAVT